MLAYFDGKAPRRAGRHIRRIRLGRRVEQIHFLGKDIVYFHRCWPAMLQFRRKGRQHYVTALHRQRRKETRARKELIPALSGVGMNRSGFAIRRAKQTAREDISSNLTICRAGQ